MHERGLNWSCRASKRLARIRVDVLSTRVA